MPDELTTLVVKIPEPFYTTHLVGNAEGDILHFGGVRIRIKGTGNLLMSIYSLDEIKSKTLVPFVMQDVTDKMPFRLINFNTQKAKIKFGTNDLDDQFQLDRAIIFVKKLFTMHPA